MRMHQLTPIFTALILASCSEEMTLDSGALADVGQRDAQATQDAQAQDALALDASPLDASAADAPAADAMSLDLGLADSGEVDAGEPDSGEVDGGDVCGALGMACTAGQKSCPGGLTCINNVCMPSGRPDCGGFAQTQCPAAFPTCRYYVGADYGTCLLLGEKVCICNLPNPPIVCP